ncbi:hypothetical protein [Methylobacterium longum]|nr:hypothetical protein [Methylobacterium longum]
MLPDRPWRTMSPATKLCSTPCRPNPGEIQRAQAGRQRRVDLNSVEEPLSRLGALDDFLQDIEDLISLGINPRIARLVLSRDDERSASARPSAVTVSRLILTKPRFDLEKTQGDECETESKPRDAAIQHSITFVTLHDRASPVFMFYPMNIFLSSRRSEV